MGQRTAVTLGTQPPNYALRVSEGIVLAGYHARSALQHAEGQKEVDSPSATSESKQWGPPSSKPWLKPLSSSLFVFGPCDPKKQLLSPSLSQFRLSPRPSTCLFYCAIYLELFISDTDSAF